MNPAEIETKILKFWQQQDIFNQSLKLRADQPKFVFYEGPPYANGKPGVHHMLARAFKDVVLRYKTMRGFEVQRRAGWDTHGLPVEVQVEKALGLKNKSEIENIVVGDREASIAKFNQYCRESVWKYKKEWEIFTERMGYWLDLQNAYVTYEPSYIEVLWSIIKSVYDQGLLVKSHKVVPYCPRCGTPLSSHEVAQEYQEVTDQSVYVKFALLNQKNTYFLAWTTTPWTLPGNVALAVNSEVEYSKINHNGEYLWLAKGLIPQVIGGDLKNLPVLQTVTGDQLVGQKYQPLFAVEPLLKAKKVHQVIAAPFVTTDEGTGIVHTAAMYGVDDYEEAVKQDLPRIHTVDETGHFMDIVPSLAGLEVQAAQASIIDQLKANEALFKEQPIKHSYPFCWRCKSRLLYYAKDSWFIEMTKLQSELIKMNSQVNWIPAHLKEGRYGEWLRELRDWSFSRERYWGAPLPVWTNQETNQHIVVGSIEELRQQAVDAAMVPKDFDPHRPNVDKVQLKDQAGLIYQFEGMVVDIWYEAGAMPFASGEEQAGRYPADYIVEAVDQTRGWFYTLQAVAALMGKTESPYKNVISLGHINDEHGKKMSKSQGNIIDPMQMGNKYGMDAIRFYMYSMNQPGQTKRFAEKELIVSYRKNQLLLANVVNYLLTYRPTNFTYQFDWQTTPQKLLDRWIVARTIKLATDVQQCMDEYSITTAARLISEYLNDLSQVYIRNNRERADDAFFQTLTFAVAEFTKVIAPFTPFIAEDVWLRLDLKTAPSVHLTDWSKLALTAEMRAVLEEYADVIHIVQSGYVLRHTSKIKLRQVLSELTIKINKDVQLSEEALAVIKQSLNVLEIKLVNKLPKPYLKSGGDYLISLNTTLTPRLQRLGDEREIKRAAQAARKLAGLETGQTAQITYQSITQFSETELRALFEQLDLMVIKQPTNSDNNQLTEVKLSNGETLVFTVLKV